MSSLTTRHYALFALYSLYWFLFFPIIWFVVRPPAFVKDLWQALLFACLLAAIYCVLHVLLLACYKRRLQQQQRLQQQRQQPGNEHIISSVYYQQPAESCCDCAQTKEVKVRGGEGGGGGQSLRFISSYELVYDGKRWADAQ